MMWNVTEHMIFLLSLAVICSFSHWQETRNQSKRLGVYCSYSEHEKRTLIGTKTRQETSLVFNKDFKSQTASLLWSQHVCDGWQLTLLWQEPSWCQRGLSSCLSTLSSHPAYPHRGSSSTDGSKQFCSFLCSPLNSRYPQLQLSTMSWSGYPCSGRNSTEERKWYMIQLTRVCKDTSWWALSPTAVQLSPPASGGFIQSSHIFNTTNSSDTHSFSVSSALTYIYP